MGRRAGWKRGPPQSDKLVEINTGDGRETRRERDKTRTTSVLTLAKKGESPTLPPRAPPPLSPIPARPPLHPHQGHCPARPHVGEAPRRGGRGRPRRGSVLSLPDFFFWRPFAAAGAMGGALRPPWPRPHLAGVWDSPLGPPAWGRGPSAPWRLAFGPPNCGRCLSLRAFERELKRKDSRLSLPAQTPNPTKSTPAPPHKHNHHAFDHHLDDRCVKHRVERDAGATVGRANGGGGLSFCARFFCLTNALSSPPPLPSRPTQASPASAPSGR